MGDSPFLAVPASEWLASNRSAFAIADRYAVSPGHTLVVPRRLIGTWWEATDDERADMLALVDEVKRQLDAARQPDGFNVGFNAGAAAGQTVGHLHVHVIPRYDGDVPDPRGGVRHVMCLGSRTGTCGQHLPSRTVTSGPSRPARLDGSVRP
jgi:diadenosine tetraphosphate (Ap4A) HIT family hydrolase